jgi:hypothetical protein
MSEEKPDMTFEEAITQTESLLDQIEAGTMSPIEIEGAIASLVQSENGARGFFVTYLTSDKPLADSPSPEVVQALQSSPDLVADLLTKNIAMSTAMTLTHRRNDDEAMAQNSQRVRDRTAHLIDLVKLDTVYFSLRQLLESVVTGAGRYQAFLDRWGYDAEQRLLISQALESVIGEEKAASEEVKETET